ncbi:amylo-alpha-1,6-glucosidase, partial [Streptomyces coryli]|uniref:amylo-alpha-1,6-glucosidase n=1 Tax=Streptomyces coryli TaxID=1128680 RepID=UPI003B838183
AREGVQQRGGAMGGGPYDGGAPARRSPVGAASAGGFSADGRQPVSSPPPRGPIPWSLSARAGGDDARVGPALASALDDLAALLLRDPGAPADAFLASGVPWRCGLDPADALWAARMLLPLGTDLAAGTLRALARSQQDQGSPAGLLPGPVRASGPQLPPRSVGIEATLLFPAVLAEARRWGLSERDTEQLLPAAERCLTWLRSVAPSSGAAAHRPPGLSGYVPDPAPGGPYRCETQAHAHRAALLGADLLDEFGRPGADDWREWAAGLRERFRADFWVEDRSGGRPAAALTPDGAPLPQLGSAAAHLLDPGLSTAGQFAEPLLDKVRTETLARLLGSPAQDCGWGLRTLGGAEPGHNPFGHGGGAVRVLDTAVAVAGLFATGYEKEAGCLLHGTLDAAAHFGHRLPEMYAGIRRTEGGAPLPHPAACRPAATAAAAVVHLLAAVAGLRPDVPAGTVAIRPAGTAPLGALHLTGWRIAGEPFSVRVSRLGMGMVEEAAAGLQLGA